MWLETNNINHDKIKNVHLSARLACYCRYEQHKYKYMCVGAVLYKAQRLECKADSIRL